MRDRQKRTLLDFYSNIAITDTCWNWTGKQNGIGYGSTNRMYSTTLPHRISYAICIGDLIKGMHIDHLCRNRICVNPSHLEQVTPRENILRGQGTAALNSRKTHCAQGHEFNKKNIYLSARGERVCKTCSDKATLKRYYRIKQENANKEGENR